MTPVTPKTCDSTYGYGRWKEEPTASYGQAREVESPADAAAGEASEQFVSQGAWVKEVDSVG